ncbi:hypothetical protein HN011_004753 [Eciton burchellii]|nr:hypothetical protein HN011_004753 [Eciton burchellii]
MRTNLQILLLLSPAIFGQPHRAKDPNNEPFLPIHPVYPYSPKLIKRDAEPELISQLTPELYASRVDAKNSYNPDDSPRDPYYPDYSNPYAKTEPPSPVYPTYYNGDPTYASINAYANSPYVAYNSYPTPPYPPSYPSSAYPGYYYQPSYYYPPHYFPQALFPPPPPPPSSNVEHHETSQHVPAGTESDKQDDRDIKKIKTSAKESEKTQDASIGQFVDGGNYISGSSRDLDVQSSTYKAGPYNQLERDAPTKSNLPSIPLPKTTYQMINVAGQPVGSDYPLPVSYAKAQQVEHLMSQSLTNLLAQKTQQQAGQSYESSRESTSVDGDDDTSYVNQDSYNPATYVAAPDARTKPAVAYVINGEDTAKVNKERPSVQASLESSTPRAVDKNARYSNVHYARKPVSSGTHTPRGDRDKHQHRDSTISGQTDSSYTGYEGSQDYGVNVGHNREQSYGTYQGQPSSYRNKDPVVAAQTPRSYYQYSTYGSDQVSYVQQDKISSDESNFGAKRYNKG